jgi:hypothetical protein
MGGAGGRVHSIAAHRRPAEFAGYWVRLDRRSSLARHPNWGGSPRCRRRLIGIGSLQLQQRRLPQHVPIDVLKRSST